MMGWLRSFIRPVALPGTERTRHSGVPPSVLTDAIPNPNPFPAREGANPTVEFRVRRTLGRRPPRRVFSTPGHALSLLIVLTGCNAPTSAPPKAASSVAAPAPAPTASSPAAAANPALPLPGVDSSTSPGLSGTQTPAAPSRVDYETAKKQVETTLRAHPNDYELRMNAARFYMQAGDHASAIPHLQAAVRLSPKQVLPWIALGDASTLSGKFAQAEQAYNHAHALQPDNPLVDRGRGQLLVLQQKFYPARDLLIASLKRHPDDAETRTALGNLYLVLNHPRSAIETLKPALEKEPNRADLHLLLGEAYERDLHLEAAIAELREATRLEPAMAEAWGRLGLYQINLTRYKEAREPLQRAIALEPNEAHYYWALGDSYLLESTDPANFDLAAQYYRKALQLNPKNDKALYSFAMALTRRGRPQDLNEAVGLLLRLIKINPIDTNAEYKLAETYQRLGNKAEAQKHRKRFDVLFARGRNQTRRLYATAANRDTALAHLEQGQAAMQRKDYAQASQEFQLALQRDQSLSAARKGLVQAQTQMGLIGKTRKP